MGGRLDPPLHELLSILCGAFVEIYDLVHTLASRIGELRALLGRFVDVGL